MELESEQTQPAVLARQFNASSPFQNTHQQEHPPLDITQSQEREMDESMVSVDDAGISQGMEGLVDLQDNNTDVSNTTRSLSLPNWKSAEPK